MNMTSANNFQFARNGFWGGKKKKKGKNKTSLHHCDPGQTIKESSIAGIKSFIEVCFNEMLSS